jgi:hypothetical protein
MIGSPDLESWLQSLKGESERASDARIHELLTNPAMPKSAAPGPPESPRLPASIAAIHAALSDTFMYSEIARRVKAADERAILANSDTVMIAGRRRLRLRAAARAELLNRVMGTRLYDLLLKRLRRPDERDAGAVGKDEVRRNNAWLRGFLAGRASRVKLPQVHELRSALHALESLTGVKLPETVPPLTEVQRRLGLEELLEPLRLLIGSESGPRTHRFVGRTQEQRALRAFVDELASRSTMEALERGVGRLGKVVNNVIGGRTAGNFVIAARGGLGKSSLIAKFVLDHAIHAEKPFPFAYLDFDRAGLQPRDPRLLLAEVLRQVGLQFEEISEGAEAIRRNLESLVQDEALGAYRDEGATSEWAAAVDLLNSLTMRRGCAFLLVLDTMEVVQSDSRALSGVIFLVNQLTGPRLPATRVVAAGRADVPELRNRSPHRSEGKLLELDPLAPGEALEMANSLGASLLRDQWQPHWGNRIAGPPESPDSRREPLTIRVAVELVLAAEPDKREAVTRDIEKMGEEASAHFVGALYQRRVLDHVRDLEVKKLAWPGLVLRRVTPDLVRDVLAGICGLDAEKIPETFAALSNEAWIVTRDGDALKHQPDLRARTLPLMRRHDRKKFDEVNARAIAHFQSRMKHDPRARAEFVYHSLLGGATPESIRSYITSNIEPYLAGADADFPPGSATADYLFMRTAPRFSAIAARRMNPTYGMQHIANTAPYVGDFSEESLNDVLRALDFEEIDESRLDGTGQFAHWTLLIKTGRWSARTLERLSIVENISTGWGPGAGWGPALEFASCFRDARMQRPPQPKEWNANSNYPAIVQRIAQMRLSDSRSEHDFENLILEALETRSWRVITDGGAALRTAAVFSRRLARPASRFWLEQSRSSRPGSAAETLNTGYSLEEIRALAFDEKVSLAIREVNDTLWENIFEDRGDNAALVMQPAIWKIVDRHLRELVTERDDARSEHALRRFAAARDADWVTPLAYAAQRATDGVIPPQCRERLDFYDIERRGTFLGIKSARSRTASSTDYLQLLRTADRASDLRGMLNILMDSVRSTHVTSDLRLLYECHARWRQGLEEVLEQEAPHDDDHRPFARNA